MNILYFAWLRQKVGTGSESIDLPDGVTSIADLIDWLKTRSPGHAEAFADLSVVRCAVNQDYVPLETPVRQGDEVAFFPPVTGGAA